MFTLRSVTSLTAKRVTTQRGHVLTLIGRVGMRERRHRETTYLLDLVLIGGRVELFGYHERGVICLEEALLVGARIQIAQAFVHAVHAGLEKQFKQKQEPGENVDVE